MQTRQRAPDRLQVRSLRPAGRRQEPGLRMVASRRSSPLVQSKARSAKTGSRSATAPSLPTDCGEVSPVIETANPLGCSFGAAKHASRCQPPQASTAVLPGPAQAFSAMRLRPGVPSGHKNIQPATRQDREQSIPSQTSEDRAATRLCVQCRHSRSFALSRHQLLKRDSAVVLDLVGEELLVLAQQLKGANPVRQLHLGSGNDLTPRAVSRLYTSRPATSVRASSLIRCRGSGLPSSSTKYSTSP